MNGRDLVKDNAFRNAFNAISRQALPFMAEDAYHSDLLYDAATASVLPEGEVFYVLVRELGTSASPTRPLITGGKAVLRIERRRYDTYDVDVIQRR